MDATTSSHMPEAKKMCDGMWRACVGRRRDLRVHAGRAHAERRVDGIVVGVDQVVGGAGVLRVLREDLLHDRRGPHVGRRRRACPRTSRGAPARRRLAASRSSGNSSCEPAHRLGVSAVAVRLFAVARRGPRRRPGTSSRARSAPSRGAPPRVGASRASAFARGVAVLLHPERMVVRHRLAPVRHGEVRDRPSAPRGIPPPRRRTRSCGAAARRAGNAPAPRRTPTSETRCGPGPPPGQQPLPPRAAPGDTASDSLRLHIRVTASSLSKLFTTEAPGPRTGTWGAGSSSRTAPRSRTGTADCATSLSERRTEETKSLRFRSSMNG